MKRLFALCPILLLAACAHTAPRALLPYSAPVPPPAVPIPPTPPKGEPSDYLNMPAANLRGLLGTPQFERADGATTMWRYDSASCKAFFFLAGPVATATVRHVETLPAGTISAADPGCLAALRASKKAS